MSLNFFHEKRTSFFFPFFSDVLTNSFFLDQPISYCLTNQSVSEAILKLRQWKKQKIGHFHFCQIHIQIKSESFITCTPSVVLTFLYDQPSS